MELKQLHSDGDKERWNSFVDSSPQGSVFTKTWYQEAIGLDYTIWVVEQGDELVAGMLLGHRNGKWSFGPFQKYTGILFAEMEGSLYTVETNRRAALRLLLTECTKLRNFDYFFHPEFGNWLLFYQNGYKETTYYTYRLQVKGETTETLLANCAPRLRTKIRKTLTESEITIAKGLDDACYLLLKETFERKGGKIVFTRALFDALCTSLDKNAALAFYRSINKAGEVTSVLGIAYDKRCAYLLFSGYDEKSKQAGDNERLIYEALKDATNTVECFDFEGSMLKGVESYYRQFGGRLTPYFRIYKPTRIALLKEFLRPGR